jgi:hypothetical protein
MGASCPFSFLISYGNVNVVNPISMSVPKPLCITLIGAGTIGLSFAALHLGQEEVEVIIYDTRPDIESYVYDTLPG